MDKYTVKMFPQAYRDIDKIYEQAFLVSNYADDAIALAEKLEKAILSLEEQYGKILGEMQGIREELGRMGEGQTKIQLSDITGQAQKKIQEFGEQLKKMKENLVKSAKL